MDVNSSYAYLLFTQYFSDTCIVADAEGELVGFVLGFRPPDQQDTLFVWQITVDPSLRGRGIGVDMLGTLLERLSDDVRYLEATITPSNLASQRMFQAVARRFGAPYDEETTPLFPRDLFPGSEHEDELLIHIGPIDVTAGKPEHATSSAAAQ